MIAVAWKVGLIGGPPVRISPDPAREPALAHGAEAALEVGAPESPAALPPLDLTMPPRSKVAGSFPGAATRAGASASASGTVVSPSVPRVLVEASSTKPGTGQPVDFAARLAPAVRTARIDNAQFLIAGPGVAAGTAIPASDDGTGVFRTTFTFLQAGHFDVAFTARADGSLLRGERVVVVGEGISLPAAAPAEPAEPASPPPANATQTNQSGGASARWL